MGSSDPRGIAVFLLLSEEGAKSARGLRRSVGKVRREPGQGGRCLAKGRPVWPPGQRRLAVFGIYALLVPNTCSIGELGLLFLYVKHIC